MWHPKTCALFKEHVDGLPEQQGRDIRDKFFFISLCDVNQIAAWRRLRAYVRLQVTKDRSKAEGILLRGFLWIIMCFGLRLIFFLTFSRSARGSSLWILSIIDIMIFGKPLVDIMTTCMQISCLKQQDLDYLKLRREATMRTTGENGSALQDLLDSIISLDDSTQSIETILAVNVKASHVCGLVSFFLGLMVESLWDVLSEALFGI